jgi:hypothetical protein
LKKHDLLDAPKLLALYKEVEDYYYGDATTPGLQEWEGLDDLLLLLSDDNFGNLRTLPTEANKDREAGFGLYYHFDYHGGPISYEWVNSSTLEKTWEQMSMAYDYGIRKLWIVNVGDLRPQELPLSFFMDLAYDFEKWGSHNFDSPSTYLAQWVERQFPYVTKNEAMTAQFIEVLKAYTHMNADSKPEATNVKTFCVSATEGYKQVALAKCLEMTVEALQKEIPPKHQDAFYGLVGFPVLASANVRLMNLYAAFNQHYASMGSVLANDYAERVARCVEKDAAYTTAYNEEMSGGKWHGMMGSAHIGFTHWNDEDWQIPKTTMVTPKQEPCLIVSLNGSDAFVIGETDHVQTLEIPVFSNVGAQMYTLTLSNGGAQDFSYTVTNIPEWLTADYATGHVDASTHLILQSEPNCQENLQGEVVITGAGAKIRLLVRHSYRELTGIAQGAFLEADGLLSIGAAHFRDRTQVASVRYEVLQNRGKTPASVKMFPTTVSFVETTNSPTLSYPIHIWNEGEYEIMLYLAPINDLRKGEQPRIAVGLDDAKPHVLPTLPEGFRGGSHYDHTWCAQVLRNDIRVSTNRTLLSGAHTLKVYGLDAGVVLEQIVLCKVGSPAQKSAHTCFYPPKESGRVDAN